MDFDSNVTVADDGSVTCRASIHLPQPTAKLKSLMHAQASFIIQKGITEYFATMSYIAPDGQDLDWFSIRASNMLCDFVYSHPNQIKTFRDRRVRREAYRIHHRWKASNKRRPSIK